MGQLSFDFSSSASQRRRKHKAALIEEDSLFSEWSPDIDLSMYDHQTITGLIAGAEKPKTAAWLSNICSPVFSSDKAFTIPTSALPALLYPIPPAHVSMDAPTTTLAQLMWAYHMGLPPITVVRHGNRLLARTSRKYPPYLRASDIPWNTVLAVLAAGLNVEVDPDAQKLFDSRLVKAGLPLGVVASAGPSLIITTSSPTLLESRNIPGLAHAGPGKYTLPLLLGMPLLKVPQLGIAEDVKKLIKSANVGLRPKLELPENFPWTLYDFQTHDTAAAERILTALGGVLLAGEMGSGKTTVSLALVAAKQLWPLLVLAPLSAFSTWDRQLSEMGKNVLTATGPPSAVWESLEAGGYDAVVMSYDRTPAFLELLTGYGFVSAIADEVQRIRTPGSKRSRALRTLAPAIPNRIGLSGTPLVNSAADLLPIGAWLAPSQWPARPGLKDLSDIYVGDPLEGLAEHLGSYMVRRRMEDTGASLPARRDHRVFVTLTSEQTKALQALKNESAAEAADGKFDQPGGRMHAFAKLQLMRQILNCPAKAGISGRNPKVDAAVALALDFLAMDRKGVIFTADRTSFREIGEALDDAGIGWVGIWGSTPAADRISNEKKFHTDPNTKVVLCTIQAGAESWSASPTGTWLICTSYVYALATLDQMAARVWRMSSDPNGPVVEVCYIHAQAPEGTLDDRMLEILNIKRQLFSTVVDRKAHVDTTKVHYSMGDLMYLMTGQHIPADDKPAPPAPSTPTPAPPTPLDPSDYTDDYGNYYEDDEFDDRDDHEHTDIEN